MPNTMQAMRRSDKPFGEALGELMDAHEMRGGELARRLVEHGAGTKNEDAKRSLVSAYRRGIATPSLEAMEEIAYAMETAPSYFAEHRLERIRQLLDYHPTPHELEQRGIIVARALREARSLGLDV